MAGPNQRIDWPGLMRAGLHGLGLEPRDFWALTPIELMIMMGREGIDPGFSRASLDALMTRFPDKVNQTTCGGTDDST